LNAVAPAPGLRWGTNSTDHRDEHARAATRARPVTFSPRNGVSQRGSSFARLLRRARKSSTPLQSAR